MIVKSFNTAYEEALEQLETLLDSCDADLDYDTANDILTIEFDNGSKLIINRQGASNQLWVAARSGGFHYNYDESSERWLNDRTGTELFEELSRLATEQSGAAISFRP